MISTAFSKACLFSLFLPHTLDLVNTIGQAQEGLKYYQQKHKVPASLKDFWAPTLSTLDVPSGSAN